ncbi:MAG: hypothetical protein J5701_06480, partial [Bacteroidales bacterium]|nr:hypothetical protein [Bacteroidales bacterium]
PGCRHLFLHYGLPRPTPDEEDGDKKIIPFAESIFKGASGLLFLLQERKNTPLPASNFIQLIIIKLRFFAIFFEKYPDKICL